jgi:hypothetical protein
MSTARISASESNELSMDGEEQYIKDEVLIKWIETQGRKEFNRLKSFGLTCLFFMPKNFGLVVDYETHPSGKPTLINRIEFGTAFQFTRVTNVQLSPPTSCRAAYATQRPASIVPISREPILNSSTNSTSASTVLRQSYYDYRHIILSCQDSPGVYMIVPYIYPSVLKWKHPKHGHMYHLRNKLDEWLFINTKLERARLKVTIN